MFSIIEEVTPETLIQKEQWYIDMLNPFFNICKIAASTLGFRHSEDTKRRMSISKTGKKKPPMSEEQKIKISISLEQKARVTVTDSSPWLMQIPIKVTI